MIIVTGAAGFLGSNVILELNAQGHEDIICVDKLGEDGQWKNLQGLKFIRYLDAEDVDLEKGISVPVKAVFHFGGCSSTTEMHAGKMLKANYDLSIKWAIFAQEHNAKFIYASSSTTYGDGSQGMDDKAPIDSLHPLNIYGYSKHLFDLWALKNAPQAIGLKLFNIFGPGEEHKGNQASIIYKGYLDKKANRPKILFTPPHPITRDLLYVKDMARMAVHFMHVGDGGLYNIGSGVSRTFESVLDAMGCLYVYDSPLPPNYQFHTEANISKLRQTGYTPSITPLSQAITESITHWDSL